MQALINAGGKGTRMGACGIEKPMQTIEGKPIIKRVVDALTGSVNIDKVTVSVSGHTLETEKYLKGIGVETVKTSGEDFMGDLHESFEALKGEFILICPSDLPFISTAEVDKLISAFDPKKMESITAIVSIKAFDKLIIKPSYTMNYYGSECVYSGVSILDREKILQDVYLQESFYETDSLDFAVNVNTQEELEQVRKIIGSKGCI